MNYRLILGAVAVVPMLFTSISAQAADMRVPSYKAPIAAPAPFSWTGFYVGAHVGAGWGTKNFDYNDLTTGAPFLWDSAVPINGALGGGQVGYNWQSGWTVFGIEADGSWADLTGHSICNTTTFFLNCSAKTSAIATLTGRLGGSIDRALIYVKGGVAWDRDRYTISNVALPPLATAFSSSLSDDRTGWTLGMGIEYAFVNNWSAKLEYDYMDFGTKRGNFPATSTAIGASNFTNWDLTQRIHTMKVGINYHFSTGCCDQVAVRY
jgi:outer membrane immunogenic protein